MGSGWQLWGWQLCCVSMNDSEPLSHSPRTVLVWMDRKLTVSTLPGVEEANESRKSIFLFCLHRLRFSWKDAKEISFFMELTVYIPQWVIDWYRPVGIDQIRLIESISVFTNIFKTSQNSVTVHIYGTQNNILTNVYNTLDQMKRLNTSVSLFLLYWSPWVLLTYLFIKYAMGYCKLQEHHGPEDP